MHAASPPRASGRSRRSGSPYESERKRARVERLSPDVVPRRRPSDRDAYESHRSPFSRPSYPPRDNNELGMLNGSPYGARPVPIMQPPLSNTSKSRRLYIGNVPFHVGLTDTALTQFFSALYIAGFGPNKPGEPLPVISFWLHADGKFGFMELRGEQEAVNMMQFNGVFLHGRPLRVNRPSDYRPEVHNPSGMNLIPDVVNVRAVMELCDKLGGIASAPVQLAAIAASQTSDEQRTAPYAQASRNQTERTGNVADGRPPLEGTNPGSRQTGSSLTSQDQRPGSTAAKQDVAPRPEPVKRSGSSPVAPGNEQPEYKVISLENLVTDDDLDGDEEDYEDLVADVQAECENYGSVEEIVIPRSGIWKRTAFILFKNSSEAKKAVESLKKRVFDKRQIAAIGLPDCRTATEAAARSGTGSSSMRD